jgi:hypothetical protein
MVPRALAALALAAAGSVAYMVVSSVAEAIALTVLGACVPASWVTWRMVAYGSLRKPCPVRAWPHVPARPAIGAAPKMIENRPVVTATVLNSYQEVMK